VPAYREQRGQGDFATRFAREVMLATPRGVSGCESTTTRVADTSGQGGG
jgi:hypothetical protein